MKDAVWVRKSREHNLKLKPNVHAASETPSQVNIPKRSLHSDVGLKKSVGSPESRKILRENILAVFGISISN